MLTDKMVPLRGRLTVRRLLEPGAPQSNGCYAIEDVRPGEVRLITPDVAIQRSRYGEVLAVGPGRLLKDGRASAIPEVAVGDRVWWGAYTDADSQRPWEDDVALLQEADIVAIERDGKLEPLGDRILVIRDENFPGVDTARSRAAAYIIIPDVAQDKATDGVVVAAGPGRQLPNGQRAEMDIAVGDRVAFDADLVQEATLQGREYLVLRAADVLAVLG